jgi:hypothetical protein
MRMSAISLVIRAESGMWTTDVAKSVYELVLPTDAVFVKNLTSAGVEDQVYRSVQLATAFPSALFADVKGKIVRPGTFNLTCAQLNTGGLGGCIIGLGEGGLNGPVVPPTPTPRGTPTGTATGSPMGTATP